MPMWALGGKDDWFLCRYIQKMEKSSRFQQTEGVKAASDEEIVMVGVGYNLGGIAIDINYADVENLGNTSGSDGEFLQIRTIQKF